MRLVPVNDSFKIECAAGEITLTRWEAIELAQLAHQLQGQLQSLKDQRKPYPIASEPIADAVVGLDIHHTVAMVRFVGENGRETSFNLPEDVAERMRDGLTKKLEQIRAAKSQTKQ